MFVFLALVSCSIPYASQSIVHFLSACTAPCTLMLHCTSRSLAAALKTVLYILQRRMRSGDTVRDGYRPRRGISRIHTDLLDNPSARRLKQYTNTALRDEYIIPRYVVDTVVHFVIQSSTTRRDSSSRMVVKLWSCASVTISVGARDWWARLDDLLSMYLDPGQVPATHQRFT